MQGPLLMDGTALTMVRPDLARAPSRRASEFYRSRLNCARAIGLLAGALQLSGEGFNKY